MGNTRDLPKYLNPWCVLVDNVMFWCPPEVVKVLNNENFPKYIVATDDFGKNWMFEFPNYFFLFIVWWFFKWQKLNIIWTKQQNERISLLCFCKSFFKNSIIKHFPIPKQDVDNFKHFSSNCIAWLYMRSSFSS